MVLTEGLWKMMSAVSPFFFELGAEVAQLWVQRLNNPLECRFKATKLAAAVTCGLIKLYQLFQELLHAADLQPTIGALDPYPTATLNLL